jgi:hypothetical protein
MKGPLRTQRLLVAAGFVIVAVGNGAEYWSVSYGEPAHFAWSSEVFGTASSVGYLLVAWAGWALLGWLGGTAMPGAGPIRALKLYSGANLAFGVGFLAITYHLAQEVIGQPYEGRFGIALATSYGFELVGFCAVSVGFWSGAVKLRNGETAGRTPVDHSAIDSLA